MNEVVIQRERWQLDRETIEPVLSVRGIQLMTEMWRLKKKLGLPDLGFARYVVELYCKKGTTKPAVGWGGMDWATDSRVLF